jgi:hypothetical protein
MAVRHPFTAAGINLDKTLKRCATSMYALNFKLFSVFNNVFCVQDCGGRENVFDRAGAGCHVFKTPRTAEMPGKSWRSQGTGWNLRTDPHCIGCNAKFQFLETHPGMLKINWNYNLCHDFFPIDVGHQHIRASRKQWTAGAGAFRLDGHAF